MASPTNGLDFKAIKMNESNCCGCVYVGCLGPLLLS